MQRMSPCRYSRFVALLAIAVSVGACASRPSFTADQPTVVEAACGECLFGLKGDGCDLAIRWNGRAYYVDGVALDSLGDAHAADGMCQVIRQARVTGRVAKGRFQAASFELIPQAPRR